MTDRQEQSPGLSNEPGPSSAPSGQGRPAAAAPPPPEASGPSAPEAPFLRAPEQARTVFLVTLAAACGPLAAGVIFFGWRAAAVVAISMLSCTVIERLYYRVTRVPALLGRSHAYLTGLLLGLTLPAFVPWYVPALAAAFAVIVGKAVFGGVGHFLWQPALVGRLAVAVLLPDTLNPDHWTLLGQNKMVVGDVRKARVIGRLHRWQGTPAPAGVDAFGLVPPHRTLAGLAEPQRAWLTHFIHRPGPALAGTVQLPKPTFSALVYVPDDLLAARPAALRRMPPINEMFMGARPGGIGETCAIVIVVAGLYLMYRNYVKWQLPVMFLAAAAVVAAVAPVQFAAAGESVKTVWLPLRAEGYDVGVVYVTHQLLSGELMLAAFFLATEMTTRPVTTGGQTIFGLACGTIAMLLKLYVDVPVPAYMAVLVMNTFVPTIDAMWRPRVLGRPFLWRLRSPLRRLLRK